MQRVVLLKNLAENIWRIAAHLSVERAHGVARRCDLSATTTAAATCHLLRCKQRVTLPVRADGVAGGERDQERVCLDDRTALAVAETLIHLIEKALVYRVEAGHVQERVVDLIGLSPALKIAGAVEGEVESGKRVVEHKRKHQVALQPEAVGAVVELQVDRRRPCGRA